MLGEHYKDFDLGICVKLDLVLLVSKMHEWNKNTLTLYTVCLCLGKTCPCIKVLPPAANEERKLPLKSFFLEMLQLAEHISPDVFTPVRVIPYSLSDGTWFSPLNTLRNVKVVLILAECKVDLLNKWLANYLSRRLYIYFLVHYLLKCFPVTLSSSWLRFKWTENINCCFFVVEYLETRFI